MRCLGGLKLVSMQSHSSRCCHTATPVQRAQSKHEKEIDRNMVSRWNLKRGRDWASTRPTTYLKHSPANSVCCFMLSRCCHVVVRPPNISAYQAIYNLTLILVVLITFTANSGHSLRDCPFIICLAYLTELKLPFPSSCPNTRS